MTKALKLKSCHICHKDYVPVSSLSKACSYPCAMEYDKRKKQRERKRALAKHNQETRERKEALKSRSDWLKEAQREFNKFIRLRDKDQPCISCGRTEAEIQSEQGWKPGGAWDCGHFLSVGSHPELRFNEYNAHKQCKGCNGGSFHYTRKGHTVSQDYRANLINRIGERMVVFLEGPHKPLKPTIDELKWLKGYYRDKWRELEQCRPE